MDSSLNNRFSWLTFKQKARNIFRWLMLIIFMGFGVFIYWKYIMTYSEGYRAGLLQKFSHKGTIFKTYEGEMVLSSITSSIDVALASEKFIFSVTDQALSNQLDTLQGQKVIVHYRQKNGVLFWRGDSRYLVNSVKIIP